MSNKGSSSNDPFRIMFGLLATVGIALVVMSLVVYSMSTRVLDGADKVIATITGIETYSIPGDSKILNRASVRYKVDNKVYTRDLDYWESSMKEGQSIEIQYQKENPYEIRYAKGDSTGVTIAIIIGGIFCTVGVSGILNCKRKKQDRLKLLENGTILKGKVRGVSVDIGVSVKGGHPYYVIAAAVNPITHKIIEARSEYYKIDITPYVEIDSEIDIICNVEKDIGAIREVQFKDHGRPMYYENGQLKYK